MHRAQKHRRKEARAALMAAEGAGGGDGDGAAAGGGAKADGQGYEVEIDDVLSGPSDHETAKPLLGPSGLLHFRAVKNTGKPTMMQSFTLAIRRQVVQTLINIEKQVKELMADDDDENISAEQMKLMAAKEEEELEARLPKWRFDKADLRKIRINRMWTFEDGDELAVYRVPKQWFVPQARKALGVAWEGSYFVQKPRRVRLYVKAVKARNYDRIAGMFDEDSKDEAKWQARAAKMRGDIEVERHELHAPIDLDYVYDPASVPRGGRHGREDRDRDRRQGEEDDQGGAQAAARQARPVQEVGGLGGPVRGQGAVDDRGRQGAGNARLDGGRPRHPRQPEPRVPPALPVGGAQQAQRRRVRARGAGEPLARGPDEKTKRLKAMAPQKLNRETMEVEYTLTLRMDPDAPKGENGEPPYEELKEFDLTAKQREKDEEEVRKRAEDKELWSDDEDDPDAGLTAKEKKKKAKEGVSKVAAQTKKKMSAEDRDRASRSSLDSDWSEADADAGGEAEEKSAEPDAVRGRRSRGVRRAGRRRLRPRPRELRRVGAVRRRPGRRVLVQQHDRRDVVRRARWVRPQRGVLEKKVARARARLARAPLPGGSSGGRPRSRYA